MAVANSSMIRTGGIVSRVAAGAGIAVLGMGIASLRVAGNFEQSMNILQAVMEPTEKQMKQLSDTAVALGADMKLPNVSAKDAADAMVELGKGGLSLNQVLTATRGTLQLGLAANVDYAESARIVARTLKAFGLEGGQATKIANLLAAGANKSTAEITDLALGLQNASSQFRGAGLSVEELITSLAVMVDHGVSGELAGTALKTMLVRLQGPTQKAADLMKELGIDVFNSKGEMLKMPGIIAEFQKGLKGLTQEQRENVLVTLFGTRANSAMRILLSEGVKGYQKYKGSIEGTNAAQKMAEARTKGFNGAVQGLFSQVETLAIELGMHMLPAATRATKAMAEFVRNLDSSAIISFFGALADGVAIIWNFVTGNDAAFSAIVALTAGFVAYKAASAGAAAATAIMNVATMLLNGTLTITRALLFSMGVGALIAIAAGLVMAYQRSETFRNVVHGALHAVGVAFEFLKGIVMTVVNFIRDHWQLLVAIITGPIGIVTMLIIKNWEKIKSTTMAIWGAIAGFFKKWWPLLFVIFLFPLAIIFAIVNRTWRRIWSITQTVWNTIKAVISSIVKAVVSVIRTVWGAIDGVVKAIWNAALNVVRTILGRIRQEVMDRFNAVKSFLSGFIGVVRGLASGIGRAIIEGILSGLGGLLGAVKNKITDGLKGALDAAKGFLGIGSPSKLFEFEVGKPMAQGIQEGFRKAIRALPRSVEHDLRVAARPLTQGPPALAALPSAAAGGQTVYMTFSFPNMVSLSNDRETAKKIADLVTPHIGSAARIGHITSPGMAM